MKLIWINDISQTNIYNKPEKAYLFSAAGSVKK